MCRKSWLPIIVAGGRREGQIPEFLHMGNQLSIVRPKRQTGSKNHYNPPQT